MCVVRRGNCAHGSPWVVYAQLYFILLSNATSKMSEPNAFPRFLFVGQVYYYLFWYRMMATDGETDVLFWGMPFLIVRLRCGLGSAAVLLCVAASAHRHRASDSRT